MQHFDRSLKIGNAFLNGSVPHEAITDLTQVDDVSSDDPGVLCKDVNIHPQNSLQIVNVGCHEGRTPEGRVVARNNNFGFQLNIMLQRSDVGLEVGIIQVRYRGLHIVGNEEDSVPAVNA